MRPFKRQDAKYDSINPVTNPVTDLKHKHNRHRRDVADHPVVGHLSAPYESSGVVAVSN
jgi:hypothetical protein